MNNRAPEHLPFTFLITVKKGKSKDMFYSYPNNPYLVGDYIKSLARLRIKKGKHYVIKTI